MFKPRVVRLVDGTELICVPLPHYSAPKEVPRKLSAKQSEIPRGFLGGSGIAEAILAEGLVRPGKIKVIIG